MSRSKREKPLVLQALCNIPYSPWHSFPKWKDKEIRIDSSALKDFSQNDFTKGSIVWLLSSERQNKTIYSLESIAHITTWKLIHISPPEENVYVRLTMIEISDNSNRKRTGDKFGLLRCHQWMRIGSSQLKQ